MPLPALSDWPVESLRFSLFAPAILSFETLGLFQAFVGATPATTTKQNTGEFTESGPYEKGGVIEIRGVGNRVDVTWMPVGVVLPIVPSLGSYVDVADDFADRCVTWLRQVRLEAIRIAFGATLHHCTSGKTANNELIRELAPFLAYDPTDIQDLALQYNVPAAATSVPQVTINRLVRLQSVMYRTFGVVPHLQVMEQHAARVEFDYNTSNESAEHLRSAPLDRIVLEMLELTVAHLSKGLQ
ncbi:hypothetical protein DOT66_25075 [Ralstonia pseudosolanacearum]|uniref:hypothetical protein n=1 Tax=Ralstonia pseudosolanacearum TaxID=1310165 RepID=UPI000DAC957F|nr:hypothetical protein [Ralstonia pseudosolanacearum]QWQ11214.1 hypothetical protein KN198_13060 [Ralstonia solanacearum]RAA04486.1 hypothetical protein DOT66_25075 [Ralstonia pseudosolanacearum]